MHWHNIYLKSAHETFKFFENNKKELVKEFPVFDVNKENNSKKINFLNYTRTFKIHGPTLFYTCKSNKDLQVYHFFINLHSLYKQKYILNYKSRIKWIADNSSINERKCRELLSLLKKEGFVKEDFNKTHLQIRSKTYALKYFKTFDDSNEMPIWAAKFIHITYDKPITLNQLKTLALQYKQQQKIYAELNRVFGIKSEEKSKIKLSTYRQESIKKYCFESLATFETTSILYLQDIEKLFGYSNKSSASRLVSVLEKDKLLVRESQYKFVRSIKSYEDEINEVYERPGGAVKIHDSIYKQCANRLHFKLPFSYQTNRYVSMMETCIKQWSKNKEWANKSSMKEMEEWLKTKAYKKFLNHGINHMVKRSFIKENFYDGKGNICGTHSFTELKKYNIFGKLVKTNQIKNVVSFSNYKISNGNELAYSIRYVKNSDGIWDKIPRKNGSNKSSDSIGYKRSISHKKIGGFIYNHSKKRLTASNESIDLLYKYMDDISPILKKDINGKYIAISMPVCGQDNID